MLTGEPMPVTKAAGRPGHRRDAQPERRAPAPRRRGGRRHRALADRRAGAAGPGLQGADPAPGRPDLRGVRPGGARRSPSLTFVVWFDCRPGAGVPARARCRRSSVSDHRLPVRHGPRDADRDHGRRPARRRAGILIRGGEALERRRATRHGRLRQDRHADRGPAGRARDRRGARDRGRGAAGLAASLERLSEHPLGEAIVAAAREREARLPAGRRRSRPSTGRGVIGIVDGRRVVVGNAAAAARAAAIDPATRVRRGRQRRGRRRDARCSSPWTARPPGVIAVADPVKAESAEAVRELCARWARRRGMLTGDDARTGRGRGARRRHRRRVVGRGAARAASRRRSGGCRPRAGRWRWSATASTTRRRWRRPTSASRWAPAPTWRSRRPTSR